MQLKLHKAKSISHSLGVTVIKILFILAVATLAVLLLEKINFPSPEKDIKKDITNEVIKLK
jgi:hypothetical protein